MQSKTWAKVLIDSENGGVLLQRARQLLRLRELADQLLPQSLRPGYSLASFKPGEVVVFIAKNSSISSKIRLFDANLREIFARNGFHVDKIRVEIDPSHQSSSPPRAKRARLSATAADCFDKLAERLPADSPLSPTVRSIARQGPAGPHRSNGNDR